jgi:uncharacterized protein YceK
VRFISAAACAVGVLLVLSGCASVPSQLSDAAGQAASATSSAALAIELSKHSGATDAVVATSLGDSLRELQGTQQSVTELSVTSAQSADRATALASIRQAVDAVVAQQEALDVGATLDAGALTSAAKQLTALEANG